MIGKRGLIEEELIFIILNLVFFSVMLFFVSNSLNGKALYEQAYAKEIALMIDNSFQNMTIFLDISELISLNSKIDNSMIYIDNKNKKAVVKLSNSGRSFSYFVDYNITTEIQGDKLKIIIK